VRHFRLEPLLVLADGVEFLPRVKECALDTLRLDRRPLGATVYRFSGLFLQPRGQVVDASVSLVGTRRELVELASKSFIGALCGIDEFRQHVVESSLKFRELSVYRVSFASCTGAPRVELPIIQSSILRLSPGLESVSTRPEHAELFLKPCHDDFRFLDKLVGRPDEQPAWFVLRFRFDTRMLSRTVLLSVRHILIWRMSP